MRRWVPRVLAVVAVSWVGAAAIQAEDPIVPVYHEPHHRQVFVYGTTRILDVQIPPGDTSWYHSHESPILYVTLSSSQNRVQLLGQDWNAPPTGRAGGRGAAATPADERETPARVSSTTSYVERPVTHRLQNVGDRLFRLVAVLNETAGDPTTSAGAAGFDLEPELTNPWYRAYRFTVEPGRATPRHHHGAQVVIVQSTSGEAQATGAMRFDLNEPGRWAFFDAGVEHEIRNIGDRAVELVEVEVRRPVR